MRSLAKFYASEMRKKYGQLYVAWPVGNNYELGDYGLLTDGVFTRYGNVSHFGLTFETLEDNSPSDESYCSEGVSTTKITAEGKAVTGAGDIATGFEVEFSGSNQVLFEAVGIRIRKIDNVTRLGAELKGIYNTRSRGLNGELWNKKYVVITELSVAAGTTVLISNSKKASIRLQASADMSRLKLSLADPRLGLSYTSERGINTKVIAKQGATPLFRLMGIKVGWIFSSNDDEIPVRRLSRTVPGQMMEEEKFSASAKGRVSAGVEARKYMRFDHVRGFDWTGMPKK